MTDDWITVTSFTYPGDANLAKCHLEADGIEVFLADENLVSAHNLYSNAVGGVRLRVHRGDVPRAIELLGLEVPPPQRVPQCPHCGFSETKRLNPRWLPLVFAILLEPLLLLFMKRRWKCQSCGQVFRESEVGEWNPTPPSSTLGEKR